MSPSSLRGLMLISALVMAFIAVVLFFVAQQTPTPGMPLVMSCIAAGLLAAAGSLAAGGMVVGALAGREPVADLMTGSQKVDAA